MSDKGIESGYEEGGVRQLLSISLPMVVSCACDTLMMFIDRLFLSRLGSEYMSAAMGGGVCCFMFMTFFMGLTGYSNALVAQHLGAGIKEKCSLVTTQALIISIVGFPIILACIPLGRIIFEASGIAEQQLIPQFEYFQLVMYSTVFGLMRNSFSAFFSGIGRTRIVMIAAGSSLIINVFINYLLIFGNLGFPAMGIRGAAIGTIIGTACSVLILCWVYFGRVNRVEFRVVENLRFAWGMLKKLLRLGSSFGVEMLLNIMAFNLMILAFHSYGIAVAGAVTIAYNWDMVAFIPLIGVEVGVTSLVGRFMGAGDPDMAHKVMKSGLKVAGTYSFLTLVVFLLFASPLTLIFEPEEQGEFLTVTAPLAIYMIKLISIYVLSLSAITVFAGALRGAGDTFWTMMISVFGHWVMAVVILVMSRVFNFDARHTWIGMVASVLFMALIFFLRYQQGSWRKLRIVQHEQPIPEVQNDAQINL